MNKLFIILPSLLVLRGFGSQCSKSNVLNPKYKGNFLVVRNLEAALHSTRSLAFNMNNIHKNIQFDENQRKFSSIKDMDKIVDMMKKSMELKTRFEATAGEIMGNMTTIDSSRIASPMYNHSLSLSEAATKIKTLKTMVEQEITSAADQFGDILKEWSGGDVLQHLQKEIEKIEAMILSEQKYVEKLQKLLDDQKMYEADNEADAHEAERMLVWLENHEAKQNLTALELMDAVAKYNRQSARATVLRTILKSRVEDAQSKLAKEEGKLAKLEEDWKEKVQTLKARVGKMHADSTEHALVTLDAVTSFFHQKKNMIALSTALASYDQFIRGWLDHWANYDSMPTETKVLYMDCWLESPMGWGIIAPEMWTSVQVFPALLKRTASDGLRELEYEDDMSQVRTYRDSLLEMHEYNQRLRADSLEL